MTYPMPRRKRIGSQSVVARPFTRTSPEVGSKQAIDQFQRSRFARPASAEQNHSLALSYGENQILQQRSSVEAERSPVKFNGRFDVWEIAGRNSHVSWRARIVLYAASGNPVMRIPP